MSDAITVEAAWEAIESALVPLGRETVALENAAGRVLHDAVLVDRDLPPFDRAAMDGYAVRAAATRTASRAAPVVVSVAGEAAPGAPFGGDLAPGAVVRIMTGAPVPAACDAIVPVEDTSGFDAGPVQLFAAAQPGAHVVPRGSERRAGDRAYSAGHRLRAADIGALAAIGAAELAVGRRPRVAVLSTGDELVAHTAQPGPASIRDANAPLVAALAAPFAADVQRLARVPDDRGALRAAIDAGLRADVLVVTGGVSMGVHDLVAEALAAAGVRMLFRRVALQPGKPAGFGVHARGCVLALPGNPVSALTTFRLFAAPALRRLEGESGTRPRFGSAPARFAWRRRNPKWLLLPGRTTPAGVERVPYAGSGDLLAYADADCQIVLGSDLDTVAPGMPVPIWPLG